MDFTLKMSGKKVTMDGIVLRK